MDLKALTGATMNILDRSDFIVSMIQGPTNMSFDMVGRRDDLLILVKLLENRKALSSGVASDMKSLARVLSASPMLLIPSKTENYQDGVLYISFGIPLMTLTTFYEHLVEEVPPMVYSSSGGHFVTLDGPKMKEVRENCGISLGLLAQEVGVSRRAVHMYESGMGADLDVAIRIEEALGCDLVIPLDPFSSSEELTEIRESMMEARDLQSDVLEHLGSIGMEVIPTPRCPFDALARTKRELLMTSIMEDKNSMRQTGTTLSGITRVTGNESFLVATRSIKGRNIGGTPVLSSDEVKKAGDISEILELIRKRKRTR